MTKAEIRKQLFSLLETDFRINLAALNPDVSIMEQMPVDSMLLIGVMTSVEQKFKIDLPLDIIENPTLNHFIALIEKLSAHRDGAAG